MLQKMYTFIIQRGYMGSLIMLTGLAIMSFMDIKRRAVPVYMIIVMSILAIGIKIAEYIFGYKKVDVYEMFIILVVTTVFVVICVISHIMGAADALVMGIIAIVTGIKKATSVFFYGIDVCKHNFWGTAYYKKIKKKRYNTIYTFYIYILCGGDDMWLRASYTVENAVITPLFMLIIIVVMRASCDIHDNLIQRSVNSQFVIQTELGGFNDEDTDMYRIKTEEYLKRRVIFSKKYKIEPEASIVRTSSPEKTIRIVNALKELKN